MSSLLRRLTVHSGFTALKAGLRLPSSPLTNNFGQWSALIDLLKQLRIDLVLDVGANRGFFSLHLRMAGYEGHIASFEPIPRDADRIRSIAKADKRWRVYQVALGDENRDISFNVQLCNGETVLSSILPMKRPPGSSEQITVPMSRLDKLLPQIIKEIEISMPRIFLKMDTQGYDLNVFAGLGKYVPDVAGLQSEMSVQPLYEGIPHYTKALDCYEQHGFSLLDLFVVNRDENGCITEYDCVMKRP